MEGTPLAVLADALINRGAIYGKLLELGLTTTTPDHRAEFRACGFDTRSSWYWLDVDADRAVAAAWLDADKQRQVRALLQEQLLYFKPMREVIRIWFPTRRKKDPGPGP